MARRLFLHVGSMKSGTSFIQNVLSTNKETLAQEGFLFPGRRWRNQVSAVHDLIERGGAGQEPMQPDGPWHRMARLVDEYGGDAIISMEFLGPRSTEKIEQIQRTYDGTELQVIMTARDLGRQIPAMWQESVQNTSPVTWPDFLASVKSEDTSRPGPGKWFWKHQRVSEMSRRWVESVGRDHFTLITVPPKGAPSSLLWERFAGVVGLEASSYQLDVLRNPSIGVASALVLRALNEAMADDPLPRQDYHRYVKHALAKRGLVDRKEPVLGLDERWVRQKGQREVDLLRALDLRVVGDLDELLPVKVPGVHTKEISAEEQLAAAIDGLDHLIRQWAAEGPRRTSKTAEQASEQEGPA